MVVVLLKKFKFAEFLSTELARIKLACYQLDCLVQLYLPDLHRFLVHTTASKVRTLDET
ncbi:MAG: hypothetical protein P4M11_12930 [Candidatus Pacebacteria bacterium]|nr:hypothetical protein [Candidatus Paceibacterota bacterium]